MLGLARLAKEEKGTYQIKKARLDNAVVPFVFAPGAFPQKVLFFCSDDIFGYRKFS